MLSSGNLMLKRSLNVRWLRLERSRRKSVTLWLYLTGRRTHARSNAIKNHRWSGKSKLCSAPSGLSRSRKRRLTLISSSCSTVSVTLSLFLTTQLRSYFVSRPIRSTLTGIRYSLVRLLTMSKQSSRWSKMGAWLAVGRSRSSRLITKTPNRARLNTRR